MTDDIFDEPLEIDLTFDIYLSIYAVLKQTVTQNITQESSRPGAPEVCFNKEILVSKICSMNLDKLEDSAFLTSGPDGKIYACGSWLYRPVFYDNRMVPMQKFLSEKFPEAGIVFLPHKKGTAIRKRLWPFRYKIHSSYNLKPSLRIDMFRKGEAELTIPKEFRKSPFLIVKIIFARFFRKI